MKEEIVKIKNSKGHNLEGVISTPSVITEKLAILCPGFLDTKDYTHLVMLAEDLAKIGFTVIRFDPTGTWGSEGDISEYLTSQYLKDIKNVLEYMLKQNNFSHILLGGHSRGGMVSILYSAQDSRISSVLAVMPSSQRTMVSKRAENWEKNGYSLNPRDIPETNGMKEFKVPYSHVIDRKKFDVFADIKKVHVPIIVVAGELDKACLPEDVKDLFDQANEPKKFIFMENIGHDYRKNVSEIEKVNKKIISAVEML